ncbi:haloacid dehalogenase-like hydrolase family protein [Babesia bovis T2Bo]|nr:haloacid dehalogenase-like hydrolase family protein [Babesia bovis T2Bo]KAG6439930.1 haloacid dehalogenase-like hydrolase family protein [Babesia bovis T2Bo]
MSVAASKICLSTDIFGPVKSDFYRPKYFAVDIDGTFLTHNDDAQEKNRQAFSRVVAAEYNIFFCTGRPLSCSIGVLGDNYIKSTGYSGYPGIYHNGAVVYGHAGEVLRMVKFSRDFMTAFCQYIENNGLQRYVLFADMYNFYMLDNDCSQLRHAMDEINYRGDPLVVSVDDILTKNITLITVRGAEIITKQTHFVRDVDYVMKAGSIGCFDITAGRCTKAEGLKVLLEKYGLGPKDCGFIGNGTNDIEAMDLCELSFAVRNSEPTVADHAKYHLNETNDEAAFAKAIDIVYGL